jgi:hypothetical protein
MTAQPWTNQSCNQWRHTDEPQAVVILEAQLVKEDGNKTCMNEPKYFLGTGNDNISIRQT